MLSLSYKLFWISFVQILIEKEMCIAICPLYLLKRVKAFFFHSISDDNFDLAGRAASYPVMKVNRPEKVFVFRGDEVKKYCVFVRFPVCPFVLGTPQQFITANHVSSKRSLIVMWLMWRSPLCLSKR